MIMMPTAEFRIELGQGLERVTGSLRSGSRDRRSATTGAATSGRNHRRLTDGAERRVAHARTVGIVEVAVFDLLDAGEPLLHDLHIRGHDGFAEAAKFFLVLLLNGGEEGLIRNAVVLEE